MRGLIAPPSRRRCPAFIAKLTYSGARALFRATRDAPSTLPLVVRVFESRPRMKYEKIGVHRIGACPFFVVYQRTTVALAYRAASRATQVPLPPGAITPFGIRPYALQLESHLVVALPWRRVKLRSHRSLSTISTRRFAIIGALLKCQKYSPSYRALRENGNTKLERILPEVTTKIV